MNNQHNPDVLDALANLSNDEVFTPPHIANQVLDLLPNHIRSDSSIKILDPATKSGVFLREATKRFIKGLESEFPSLQERINHILTHQIYGLGITELTSLLSRRSLYCTKEANSHYSIYTDATDEQGNIRYLNIDHTRHKGNCTHCGASQDVYDRSNQSENHAYTFIHRTPEQIALLFGGDATMKFDVIIGNPPYQLSDGGQGASAKPLYHLFVQQAKKLNPTYLSMIIPSRRFVGGKGLSSFRAEMIDDKHITTLHDFTNSKDIFSGVDIKGGVCYFLREKNTEKPCTFVVHDQDTTHPSNRYLSDGGTGTVIRYPQIVQILQKIQQHNEPSFADMVSSRKPYGMPTDFLKNPTKYDYPNELEDQPVGPRSIKIHGLLRGKRTTKYVHATYPITIGREHIDTHKIFIPYAYGCGAIGETIPTPILATPILATPREVCTETHLNIGPFSTAQNAQNALSYLKTKFFRLLIGVYKTTQHATANVYASVPMQDFSQPRTDQKLYKKYQLTPEEIEFIETMIEPME